MESPEQITDTMVAMREATPTPTQNEFVTWISYDISLDDNDIRYVLDNVFKWKIE